MGARPSGRRGWLGTTARLGPAVLAALALAAGVPGPVRAGDGPAATAKEDEDDPHLFRDEAGGVPALNPEWLGRVADSRGLPVLPRKPPGDKDPAAEAAYLRELDEWQAYCEALVNASRCPARVFAAHARRDLSYAHLSSEPGKYRGQVVHYEGRLKRVRRFDPPLMAAQAGVRDLYEGWMFSDNYGVNPVCLVFTDLPPGVGVAEEMDRPAAFDGYFFKKYRYHAADSKPGQAREVPLLIGHAPVPRPAAAASPWSWSASMLVVLLALGGGTLVLGVGLHWWFRRGDDAVRRRLATAPREFIAPPPGDEPGEV